MEPPAPTAPKEEWRRWAKAARAGLDMPVASLLIIEHLLKWPGMRAARTVLMYFPLPDEVDLRALFDVGLNCRFVATRTPDAGGRLSVHDVEGPLEVHRLGFLQPHRGAPEVEPFDIDLALLPGLAFDLYGTRLGRGAGYFDELLSRTSKRMTRIGVVPAELVVDRLPNDAHDIGVSFLATEEGVIAVA